MPEDGCLDQMPCAAEEKKKCLLQPPEQWAKKGRLFGELRIHKDGRNGGVSRENRQRPRCCDTQQWTASTAAVSSAGLNSRVSNKPITGSQRGSFRLWCRDSSRPNRGPSHSASRNRTHERHDVRIEAIWPPDGIMSAPIAGSTWSLPHHLNAIVRKLMATPKDTALAPSPPFSSPTKILVSSVFPPFSFIPSHPNRTTPPHPLPLTLSTAYPCPPLQTPLNLCNLPLLSIPRF